MSYFYCGGETPEWDEVVAPCTKSSNLRSQVQIPLQFLSATAFVLHPMLSVIVVIIFLLLGVGAIPIIHGDEHRQRHRFEQHKAMTNTP